MSTPSPAPKPLARALIGVGAAALVTLITLLGLTYRLDAWLYDTMIAGVAQPVDERVLNIVIDEKSLSEIGRWPWSRRTHAQMIDRLRETGVRGVALNVLLSEPALFDPEGDALLARALTRSGNVVLPVLAEAAEFNGTSVELMPIPEFAASAAALGHVDMALDADGVARSHFLRAGLGSPHWPSLALALYQLERERSTMELPGLRNPRLEAVSPQQWVRDHQVLVPYASPPNGFRHASYSDVLNGRIPDALLRGRWVLIGVTATGMSNELAVPGYSPQSGLSGLDYQANAFNMLLRNTAIAPMTMAAQVLLSIALVVLPLLLCSLPGLRRLWRPTLLMIGIVPLISFLLLALARSWYPPTAAMLVLALGASVWIYRRLRRTHRQAQSDPLTGLANRSKFDSALEQELRTARRTGQPLSLLVLDIDHFKQFNDNSGHATGDAILRALARILRSRARRPRDLVARLGGDEFAVLLPETSAQAAATIATTIHVDLANLSAHAPDADALPPFSASIGIHTRTADDELDAEELFGLADTALYRAKQAGRNRSVSHA
ncbi:CHASE2 domain-containing protein [Pseudoxanthomonas wuyuanensis]|uniref:diguanylate cyclase n=1 Tax=Pseudoxanthomonas wuyuanensis TaxID=1073196 RepID=A0A286D732_9GAMM|nr:CHASE2 domain-containing protein [Pseudoxanthomonas wuyuanensis]KAF1721121.1 diguanylate cyclase [Pseudoxanthomonas wuyuanensis]SOD54440.1 diguanylate cyclase (GGDEF) domain-containing protein [Pseudoxanthomonas wuyuanensis]